MYTPRPTRPVGPSTPSRRNALDHCSASQSGCRQAGAPVPTSDDTGHPPLFVMPPVGYGTGARSGTLSFQRSLGDLDGFAPSGVLAWSDEMGWLLRAFVGGLSLAGPACRHRPKRRMSARLQDGGGGAMFHVKQLRRRKARWPTPPERLPLPCASSATVRQASAIASGARGAAATSGAFGGMPGVRGVIHVSPGSTSLRRSGGVGVDERSAGGATEIATGRSQRDQWHRRTEPHAAWAATNHASPSCGDRMEDRH